MLHFRVYGLGFRVYRLGFGVYGLGFRGFGRSLTQSISGVSRGFSFFEPGFRV